MKLTPTTCLALFAAGGTAQLRGFTSTCQTETVKVEGRWLTAQCRNILNTEARCSKLDLNNCLKNNFGRLEDDVFGTGYVLVSSRARLWSDADQFN